MIIEWYIDTEPENADVYWEVDSSIESVMDYNKAYLGKTPFKQKKALNISNLTSDNAKDVIIRIIIEMKSYQTIIEEINCKAILDQKTISLKYNLEKIYENPIPIEYREKIKKITKTTSAAWGKTNIIMISDSEEVSISSNTNEKGINCFFNYSGTDDSLLILFNLSPNGYPLIIYGFQLSKPMDLVASMIFEDGSRFSGVADSKNVKYEWINDKLIVIYSKLNLGGGENIEGSFEIKFY
jgi:hypothetical protein